MSYLTTTNDSKDVHHSTHTRQSFTVVRSEICIRSAHNNNNNNSVDYLLLEMVILCSLFR